MALVHDDPEVRHDLALALDALGTALLDARELCRSETDTQDIDLGAELLRTLGRRRLERKRPDALALKLQPPGGDDLPSVFAGTLVVMETAVARSIPGEIPRKLWDRGWRYAKSATSGARRRGKFCDVAR